MTLEIGWHLMAVLIIAILAWLVGAWWAYASGGPR